MTDDDGRMILLASHGTPGARQAETLALQMAGQIPGSSIVHLLVIPSFWRGMMGDDWLNNVKTRIAFGNYLEQELARESREILSALRDRCAERKIACRSILRQGRVTDQLLACMTELPAHRVVIGSPRPAGIHGLRDRLRIKTVLERLTCPLVIAPWKS